MAVYLPKSYWSCDEQGNQILVHPSETRIKFHKLLLLISSIKKLIHMCSMHHFGYCQKWTLAAVACSCLCFSPNFIIPYVLEKPRWGSSWLQPGSTARGGALMLCCSVNMPTNPNLEKSFCCWQLTYDFIVVGCFCQKHRVLLGAGSPEECCSGAYWFSPSLWLFGRRDWIIQPLPLICFRISIFPYLPTFFLKKTAGCCFALLKAILGFWPDVLERGHALKVKFC